MGGRGRWGCRPWLGGEEGGRPGGIGQDWAGATSCFAANVSWSDDTNGTGVGSEVVPGNAVQVGLYLLARRPW